MVMGSVVALPPYTYVPGQTPHPVSDPRGHAYGQPPEPVTPLDPAQPRQSLTWYTACSLFEAGYYWEAHEAWESLWHAAGRSGPVADCLKGLIKWAAAGVKVREGRPEGVRRHCFRAAQLLQDSCRASGASPIADCDVPHVLLLLRAATSCPPEVVGTPTDVQPLAGWTLRSPSPWDASRSTP